MHEAVFYYVNEHGSNAVAPPVDPGGNPDESCDQPICYDAKENVIHYKERNYRYDAQNRLTEVWNGTTTAQFCYDGKNRQIARNINGVIRFNSWDGWELREEWNELGSRDMDRIGRVVMRPSERERTSQYSSSLNVTTAYLQGSTGVIKSWSAANTLYYYQDKLGSTTHVANAIGQLVESYHYDLPGTPSYYNSLNTQLSTTNYSVIDLYAGERWIPEIGLYDLRNRFMSPELGRFLQADPIGFKGDASNLYRYCGNDPVDRSDPMGLLSGFREYRLEYDPNEKRDATHDGYHVAGVRGTENRPGDNLHLEVDRSVTTLKNIDGTKKGGDTNVTETASLNGGTPTIHQQIDVRYASGAGPKTRAFTQNNEWTHGRDAINSANRLRGELGGWIRGQNMSPSAAYNFVRDGGRFGRIILPSLQQHRDIFMSDQRIKWDDKYAPNGWRTPNGLLVAPHHPIDPYTGNPLEWNQ